MKLERDKFSAAALCGGRMPKDVPAERKRSQRRRSIPAALTSAEQAILSFPFASLPTSQALSLKKLLGKLKAKGVSPDNLSALLSIQFALDGFDSVRARERLAAFVEDVVRFEKARKRLQKNGDLLDAPALGVRPPAFRELLDALSLALHEARQNRHRLLAMVSARASKRRPRREMVDLPPDISREDKRDLLRLVRLASKSAPRGAPTITYGMPPRCPQCGNPAPELFRKK